MAAYTKYGQGYVVTIADPSCLINSMIGIDDNLQFIHNIVSMQTPNSELYVDQSHLPKAALDYVKAVLGVVYGAVASPLGTLSLIAVILAISLKPIWQKREKNGKNH
jgi:hypothetical protein